MIEDPPAPVPPAPFAPGAPAGGSPRGAPALGERSLDQALSELIERPPVACGPQVPIGEALEAMRRERVGSMMVVDADRRPLGILTLGDVLARVALPRTDPATPIAEVMTRRLHLLPAHAPAFEAALLMARENIRHVPLVRDGRLVGVVSESRLFALWRRSVGAARAAVAAARDAEALVLAAQAVHRLPAELLQEGLKPESVTQLLTALNDLVAERLLELTGCAQALQEAAGNWLVMGSQGRREQTLATDQDNAIVFDDAAPAGQRRARLLPLARQVNELLDRCGIALCRGGIMAGNAELCLSLAEWKERFAAWIDRPDAVALLNATIYFDFRPLGEVRAAATDLRRWLAEYTRIGERFLTLLVLNATGNELPLGVVRDFVLPRGGEHPHTIDLKTHGVQAFVETARVYALSCGVEETGTVARLRTAGARRGIPAGETAAWCEAFQAIQGLRLALNARQAARGEPLHNYLDPGSLNVLERNLLKESMRQGRNLQGRLARDFSLGGTSVRQ